MKVIRSRPEANFTQIWNHVLRDKSLDPMTLGVLCRMLSNVDGWETTADAMWQQARRDRPGNERGEGRRAYRACFATLERTGYLERRRLRTKTGTFETVLILHDQPAATATEIPLTDVPLAVSRSEQEEQDVSAGHNRRTANGPSVSGTSTKTPSTEHEEKTSRGPTSSGPGPTQTAAHSQASAPDDDTKIQLVGQAVQQVYNDSIEDEDALRIYEHFITDRKTSKPIKDPVRYLMKIFGDTPHIDSLLSNTPYLDDYDGLPWQCPRCEHTYTSYGAVGGSINGTGICEWCVYEIQNPEAQPLHNERKQAV